MSDILVVNAGSTSLKYEVLSDNLESKQTGVMRDIGSKIKNHSEAWKIMMDEIKSLNDVIGVGHRIVYFHCHSQSATGHDGHNAV